jgi:predicted DNA-binding protein YlxM (UPF0122 family)
MDALVRNVPVRQVHVRLGRKQIDGLVQNYDSGPTVDELAEDYGINRTTVMGHLRREGVETRRKNRRLSDKQVRRAVEIYEKEEFSLESVAEALGVKSKTIRREFIRAGVERRRPGRR